jgi:pimeloyl-ACP methyl ester carboxylesterase
MPTLPGLGPCDERADVHLADMVDYLVDYVEKRDLTEIVLVGHSWGGFPISGASARLAWRGPRPGIAVRTITNPDKLRHLERTFSRVAHWRVVTACLPPCLESETVPAAVVPRN